MATEHRRWNREMKLHCWKFNNLYIMWHNNNKYKIIEVKLVIIYLYIANFIAISNKLY